MALRQDIPVARLSLGKGACQAVYIYGFTAAEMRVPLVELTGALEHLQHLTVEQADEFAAGLMLAARVARGEVLPTLLGKFLGRRL